MILVDTPKGIRAFQLLSIRGRLRIETRTGLKSRVSTLAAAQHTFGVLSRTKKGALAEIDAMWQGILAAREGKPRKAPRMKARNRVAWERGYDMEAS